MFDVWVCFPDKEVAVSCQGCSCHWEEEERVSWGELKFADAQHDLCVHYKSSNCPWSSKQQSLTLISQVYLRTWLEIHCSIVRPKDVFLVALPIKNIPPDTLIMHISSFIPIWTFEKCLSLHCFIRKWGLKRPEVAEQQQQSKAKRDELWRRESMKIFS